MFIVFLLVEILPVDNFGPWVTNVFINPTANIERCHTATEEALTSPENIYLIRLIQTFHIEGRKWEDISYNFLIGSDGRVYEGRGWYMEGAHTFGFNKVSVGIAFVGCFLESLPQPCALKEAKRLIQLGVNVGAIAPNYSLIAHCQVSSTRSPGERLYEELKTWDRWDPSIQFS